MLSMIQYKLFIKNGGHFIWSSRDHRDKKKNKKPNYNPGQSGLDCVTVGGGTRCSSILLDWERRMRLKKSSSGTVGPARVADGAAHLWSSSLEPWNGVEALATKSTLELAHVNLFFCLTWHFTSMSKNTSSPSGCSAFASRYWEGVSVLAAGAARRNGISSNRSGNLSWNSWNGQTCWEDWICAGGGVCMRRAGGAET